MSFKRPVTDIHQIEITSRCNLRCHYCPSPKLQRPKVDMTFEHFARAFEVIRYFSQQLTQGEVNLAGIGESTLHPEFITFLEYARQEFDGKLLFATNGLLFSEDHAKLCADLRIDVYVSMHRPEKAGPAINLARKYGVLKGASSEPALAATNWAGQVNWEVTAPKGRPCTWIRSGKVMVMADGRVTTCSFDASGSGVVGHIEDDPATLYNGPYSLCSKCDHVIGVRGYDQETGVMQ
jgi:hypothetical protein